MWISKKKLEELVWVETGKVRALYNTKMIEDQKFRDQLDLTSRINGLETRIDYLDKVIHRHGIARIHKLEKKIKKYIKEGW